MQHSHISGRSWRRWTKPWWWRTRHLSGHSTTRLITHKSRYLRQLAYFIRYFAATGLLHTLLRGNWLTSYVTCGTVSQPGNRDFCLCGPRAEQILLLYLLLMLHCRTFLASFHHVFYFHTGVNEIERNILTSTYTFKHNVWNNLGGGRYMVPERSRSIHLVYVESSSTAQVWYRPAAALLTTVMNSPTPQKTRNFSTSCVTISFSRNWVSYLPMTGWW
jgi:hypothetical protein